MRGEHGRGGAGCDYGTRALTEALRERRSRARWGVRCCCNVLRKIALFVVPVSFFYFPKKR